jgi:tetratricopeptide (TPR) repeat protein
MKVNRQPLAELGADVIRRDHDFWSRYSERLIGNWVTYDTTVKDLVDWVERLYLLHDYTGFKGDRAFVRDDQAQKTFSKLRTAIGGIYAHRLRTANGLEDRRMTKEAEFAFLQAIAFCPYNLEPVAHYVQLLANLHRFDDALLIARTCLKLDPNNGQTVGIINNLETWKRQEAEGNPAAKRLAEMEQAVRDNPTNFQKAFDLAGFLLGIQQTNRALDTLEGIVNHPRANAQAILVAVEAFGQLGDARRTQAALDKLVQLEPELPEAWWNLAAFKAVTGRANEALADLRRAVAFNAKRLQRDPKARNLLAEISQDPRLQTLRHHPEFLRLLAPGGGTSSQ